MDAPFSVPIIEWGNSYGFFYLLAFIVGSLVVLYEGYRRRWPLVPWLIVMIWGVLFSIIGSKLLTIPLRDWNTALHHGHLPVTSEKTYLGGVLGGIIGIFFVRRFLGFRYSVYDTLAFALPIGLAIGRIGCLFGGCCFGTPTNLPWAITYPINSPAYNLHLAKGLISPDALTSLPIHPTQLYEIVFMLPLLVLLLKCRKILKRPGSLFYLYIILYSSFRFLEEFVREGGSTVWGLKVVQWGLAIVVLSVSVTLIWRERTWRVQPKVIEPPGDMILRNSIATVAILLFIFTGKDWFTPLEMTTLTIIALPAFVGVAFQLIRCCISSYIRWGTIIMASLSLIFMNTGLDTSTYLDTIKTSVYNFSLGGMTGSYKETCGAIHRYSVGGIGISHTRELGEDTKLKYGVNSYIGIDRNGGSHRILGINPYFQFDKRWIGLKLGIHAGDLFFYGT